MAQLKETKIYGGLDVYDSYENKNNILSVKSDYLDIKKDTRLYNNFKVYHNYNNTISEIFNIENNSISFENYNSIFFNNGAEIAVDDDSDSSFVIGDSTVFTGEDILFKVSKTEIKSTVSSERNFVINDLNKNNLIKIELNEISISNIKENSTNNLYLIGQNEDNILNKNKTLYFNSLQETLFSTSVSAKTFYATSDKRLKENIKKSTLNCTSLINKLNIKEYNFKNDEKKQKNIGIIAQDLLEILPDDLKGFYLSQNSEGFYSVNDSKFVYILAGAFQEEHKKRLELEARLDKIEKLLSER